MTHCRGALPRSELSSRNFCAWRTPRTVRNLHTGPALRQARSQLLQGGNELDVGRSDDTDPWQAMEPHLSSSAAVSRVVDRGVFIAGYCQLAVFGLRHL